MWWSCAATTGVGLRTVHDIPRQRTPEPRVIRRLLAHSAGGRRDRPGAAARGLDATGVDASPRAIAIARRKAAERGLTGVRFEVGDALDLGFLGAGFDTVVDSGVLHVFDDAERARFVESIRRVLVPGGRYHLLVFSDAQPGVWGPRRVRRDELEASLSGGWAPGADHHPGGAHLTRAASSVPPRAFEKAGAWFLEVLR